MNERRIRTLTNHDYTAAPDTNAHVHMHMHEDGILHAHTHSHGDYEHDHEHLGAESAPSTVADAQRHADHETIEQEPYNHRHDAAQPDESQHPRHGGSFRNG